ncbi:hypothetical protein EVC45_01255 [Paraburkholderia sp. UYCP14C]|uniref:hypothetical protein n=1 Tax=Paraburkholderia sp. UYCP14C TaxID=2511130 RepID=UPI001021FBB0|nr:hypothetical protein [Paraburkholderia sp. UYCP14C]RZF31720.1 hypothetical protein EVC45_01255 [Paraburkholderia sp. UYCP14C]
MPLYTKNGYRIASRQLKKCFGTRSGDANATNNAYDLSITFAATTCTYSGISMTGMALYDSTDSTLYGATSKVDQTAGIVFVVKKTSTS